MRRTFHHIPQRPQLESLEPRVYLSLAAKLPDLSLLKEQESTDAFFAPLHVAVSSAPVAAIFGEGFEFPFATVAVELGMGALLTAEPHNGQTVYYESLDGSMRYTLLPVAEWGDGMTTSGEPTIVAHRSSPEDAEFTGRHPYARPGQYHVNFALYAVPEAGTPGETRLLAESDIEVRLTPTGVPANGARVLMPVAAEDAPEQLHLATLVDSGYLLPNEPPNTPYLAGEILWFDGTSSMATLGRNAAGDIEVLGTHAYASPGTYPVTVSLWLQGERVQFFQPLETTVRVEPFAERRFPALAGTGVTEVLGAIPPPPGFPAVTTPTRIVQGDRKQLLVASIAWGDGETSEGLLVSNAAGGYDVIGTHVYRAAGNYLVAVGAYTGEDVSGGKGTNYSFTPYRSVFATAEVKGAAGMNGFAKLPPRGTF